MRILLSGAIAAAVISFAVPASAESAIEFLQNEAAERLGPAGKEKRTEARREAAEKRREAREERRAKLIEGRATARTETRTEGGGIKGLVARHAAANGIPLEVAHGVVMVESRYNAKATGPGGYIGLMQLSYRTAKGMGYTGSRAGLYDPDTNLRYGMKYLGEAYRQAGGNLCGAVSKYQGGHGVRGVTRSGAVYCGKVKKYMARKAPVEQKQQVASRGDSERS